eukprot:m.150869 g.150869  ORF g.150869 m.150869 type:complete len:1323 (+) comp11689_c1_seq3:1833-5801(+)
MAAGVEPPLGLVPVVMAEAEAEAEADEQNASAAEPDEEEADDSEGHAAEVEGASDDDVGPANSASDRDDGDDFVHVSNESSNSTGEAGETTREVYTDPGTEGIGYDDERDNEEEEFVVAGEAGGAETSPSTAGSELLAAKSELAASRLQQQQLQQQLAALRAECSTLRDDLERSEEAAETVQELSTETELRCGKLEDELKDLRARYAKLKSSAEGAAELQRLLDASKEDIAAKDALIASDMDEIKRYQSLLEAAKQKADDAVVGAAAENEALIAQLADARAESDRLRKLFDGKEIELRDANAMSREATSRAVTAEEKVDEVVKVNDDLLRQLKATQKQLDASKNEAEEALLARETQLVEQEQLVAAAEKKIVALEEDLRKLHTAHDELKVKAAGDKAALQARIDRKTAELEQVIEARENEDNEKEELRAKMAATQAHAVQVQKAALKYDQEAKAELESMRESAKKQQEKLEQYVHENVELSAKLEDVRNQLELSDGRIRELVGSNPSDPRTEIIRLRMKLTTHEQECARYEARVTDLKAQLEGVQAALKQSTSRAASLQEKINNTVDRSGQLAVAENMAKLLEEEAKTLRSRVSTEVSQRVEAQTELSQAQLDLKHLKKKVDSLEQDLAAARAGGSGYGSLSLEPVSSMRGTSPSSYGSTPSAVTSTIGGIEYFNPQSYGSSFTKSYGSSYGGDNTFTSSMTEIDTMRDLKLAEDRAKAAEKREQALIQKLHKIEAEAAGLKTHGEKSGYIGIDVHTRLIDMADERARDASCKVRELETEIISLKNRARVGRGLQYLEGTDPAVSSLMAKLNQCVIGVSRILPNSGGTSLKEADYAAQAARDERAWKARMAEQERRREEAELALSVAVDREVQRRAELGIDVSPAQDQRGDGSAHRDDDPPDMVTPDAASTPRSTVPAEPEEQRKKSPPPTTPKPKKKKGSVQDKVNTLMMAAEESAHTNTSTSAERATVSPSPKRLNTALMSKIAGSIPGAMAVGASAGDVMKAARQRAIAADSPEDDEQWNEDDTQGGPSPFPPTVQPQAAAQQDADESADMLVGDIVKAPSLTGQFSRPQIQKGKRLPSRKKSKSAISPAVPEPAASVTPEQPSAEVPKSAAVVPPPKTRPPADSDEEEDDDDWGDDDQADEAAAAPAKAALMQRMAKLAGASRGGGMPMPVPVLSPTKPVEDRDEDAISERSAAPVAQSVPKKQAPPSPAVAAKQAPAKVAAKKPSPQVAPKKNSPKPPPKTKPAEKPAPAVNEDKSTPLAATQPLGKAPAPTQLFSADNDDLFAAAKKPSTTAKGKGKKKGTSLFNLSDDSDDDWLK